MPVTIALGVGALVALAWLVHFWRAPLRLVPEPPPAGSSPLVSIVISMFNEEQNVDSVLESVRGQAYPRLEVIAVNDRSSDGTAAKLAEWQRRWPELRVVTLDHHPQQWRGKAWPMYHGARAASGEWLLFLDADLRLNPASVAQTVATCRARDWDALGILGRVRLGTFLERVLQLELMNLYLSLVTEAPHAISCGHYMLVRRSVYDATGGWAMIYDEMQDDVALPRLLSEHGYVPRMRVWLDSHTVAPYRDLPEAWRAMRRVIAGGAGFRPRHSALLALFGLLVNLLPWLILFLALRDRWFLDVGGKLATAFAAAIVGCALLAYAHALRVVGRSPWMSLTRPLAHLLVFGVQLDAAWRAAFGRLEWKGVVFGGQRAFSESPDEVREFVAFCAGARTRGWTTAWLDRLARESELLRFFFRSAGRPSLSSGWAMRIQPLMTWTYALRLALRHGKQVRAEAGVGRLWLFYFLQYGWLLAQPALWLPAWLRWSARRRGVALDGLSADEQRALRAEAFRRFEQQHRPWFQATPWDRKPGEVVVATAPASGAAH